MQKTKLGISVGLLGAAVYLIGFLAIVPFMLLAAYILFFEENEWLRKSAVKAVTIVVVFNIVYIVLGLGDNIFGICNDVFLALNINVTLDYPLYIDNIIRNVAELIQNVLLLVLGIKALSQGSLKVSMVDKLVEKNM